MIARSQIVTEAQRWVGCPFHHQASLREVGCDCIGLIVGIVDHFGLPEARRWREDHRFAGYGRLPNPTKLIQACLEYMDPLNIDDATAGDVLLFTLLSEPMHFAIISQEEPPYMIHAYEPIGRVVENRIDSKWQRRVLGAYRLRGVG